jgi:hypothetical protein
MVSCHPVLILEYKAYSIDLTENQQNLHEEMLKYQFLKILGKGLVGSKRTKVVKLSSVDYILFSGKRRVVHLGEGIDAPFDESKLEISIHLDERTMVNDLVGSTSLRWENLGPYIEKARTEFEEGKNPSLMDKINVYFMNLKYGRI